MRTKQVPAADRAVATFVFVTSRPWEGGAAWAQSKSGGKDGWADVVVLDAEDLTTWLEMCPGVHGWLATDHLGRLQHGISALRGWFVGWAERTEPAIPAELLLSGREDNVEELVAVLDGPPAEYVLGAGNQEEAVAFVASALIGLPPTVTSTDETGADATAALAVAEERARSASLREALLERSLVVHDGAAWRQWAVHEQPMVLVPMFDDPDVDAAVRRGHHVVIPRTARAGEKALAPVHRARAREAWERAGVAWAQADVLARDSRRSLVSLRRRIGRAGRFRDPAWADGPSANLLAALLLAGSWADDRDGDREVIADLTERSWRSVARDLAVLAAGEDAPVIERRHHWEFVDSIDAWDALHRVLTSEDLDVFAALVLDVLSEPDPATGLSGDERRKAALTDAGVPRRRYSSALRRGMTTALALLGAVAGSTPLAGGMTGQERATLAVRGLLDKADAGRWLSVGDLLPVLAEAAPGAFLEAVESSLATPAPAVMALFEERVDELGSPSSRHAPLLWALETLAFSEKDLPRVAAVLGRLAEQDPGRRSGNRPAASLLSALHLVLPQSAADAATRMAIVDSVRRTAPRAAWQLMVSLVNSTDHGIVLHHGPRFREWPTPERTVTIGDVARGAEALAERIAQVADGQDWAEAVALADRVPPAAREQLLAAASAAWPDLAEDVQRKIAEQVDDRVNRHASFRDAAWALADAGLQSLQQFADEHRPPGPAPEDHGRTALAAARGDAVARALENGTAGLIELAAGSELPHVVGETVAAVGDEHDEAVLALLDDDGPGREVADGLARARWKTDSGWLARTVASRPADAVRLLLAADVDESLLELLETLREDVRAAFWQQLAPWRVTDDAEVAAAERLLDHDRPYSAMWILGHRGRSEPSFPAGLAIRAMQASVSGTGESIAAIPSPQYVIGRLLDGLDAEGVDQDVLAALEWWYLPALRHNRTPHALHAGWPATRASSRMSSVSCTGAGPCDKTPAPRPPGATRRRRRRKGQRRRPWKRHSDSCTNGAPRCPARHPGRRRPSRHRSG
jgi:hypothetical protein